MKGAVLADWTDELEDWPVADVRWALRKWRTDFPSKKPNPAHISAILKDARGRALAGKVVRGFEQSATTKAAQAERANQTPEDRKAFTQRLREEVNFDMTETRHERVKR